MRRLGAEKPPDFLWTLQGVVSSNKEWGGKGGTSVLSTYLCRHYARPYLPKTPGILSQLSMRLEVPISQMRQPRPTEVCLAPGETDPPWLRRVESWTHCTGNCPRREPPLSADKNVWDAFSPPCPITFHWHWHCTLPHFLSCDLFKSEWRLVVDL